jgi:hypothetical protein
MFSGYRLFLVSILTLFCACSSANMQTQSDIAQTNQAVKEIESNQKENSTELLNLNGEFPNALRKKWQEFTANGQYRLAEESDMTFSEIAKKQLPGQGKSTINPYEYAWGDLNYPKRIENDHLAAIVVNITKSDSNKFSLVIFSPIKGKKDEYEINWLYREQDLSKATVNRASGELYVRKYLDDGSHKSCSVKWNPKIREFDCN